MRRRHRRARRNRDRHGERPTPQGATAVETHRPMQNVFAGQFFASVMLGGLVGAARRACGSTHGSRLA
ncbi:hypothetical protein A8H35_22450 [Burkholderia thailandensis]|nr:hypothetical protein A8H35_22450 [Burkholderia thailandensis]KVG16166.1 hypothetical protein WJ28_12875 [Burkholderia thailandensis]NOK43290.1 hypothetical protein [Burkholderia thailandensis]PHH33200.1 hypothetical protein CRX59_20605 [Burkholderia thailandensis]PNE84883.1 hypothetical protein A8H34_12925 [Burkholderia thailandensis]